jgi:hypothetical protein
MEKEKLMRRKILLQNKEKLLQMRLTKAQQRVKSFEAEKDVMNKPQPQS